ncbi:fumarate hydratase [Sulfolobales archaeon HS-7]|nr:fumarate hydratase [Sulfolobales archaeon HS-7]
MKYTDASRRVFLETGYRFPRTIIWAIGAIKLAAAKVNVELGVLEPEIGDAIQRVAREVMNGSYDGGVVVDVFQTGSGTGLNMNINEIIAEEASKILGKKVHPNDHVNVSQSSNDVVPSAIRIAALKESNNKLIPSLQSFADSLSEVVEKTKDVYKAGRTHLRDAMPITMGNEFSAYLDAVIHDISTVRNHLEYVREIPIGGTAVGTGINAPPEFSRKIIDELNAITGLNLIEGNKFRGMRLLTDLLGLSSTMRQISVELYRLSQDLRLMFSGPITGLGEIDIMSQEEIAGSSIMPGKTNPVTVESAMQGVAEVIGLDHANQILSMYGEFELSMGIPVMGYNIISQIEILSQVLNKLSSVVLSGIVPNKERCIKYAESSPSLITILSPTIGYDKASEIGRKVAKGVSIRDSLRELNFSEDQINKILDMERLVKGGVIKKITQS